MTRESYCIMLEGLMFRTSIACRLRFRKKYGADFSKNSSVRNIISCMTIGEMLEEMEEIKSYGVRYYPVLFKSNIAEPPFTIHVILVGILPANTPFIHSEYYSGYPEHFMVHLKLSDEYLNVGDRYIFMADGRRFAIVTERDYFNLNN